MLQVETVIGTSWGKSKRELGNSLIRFLHWRTIFLSSTLIYFRKAFWQCSLGNPLEETTKCSHLLFKVSFGFFEELITMIIFLYIYFVLSMIIDNIVLSKWFFSGIQCMTKMFLSSTGTCVKTISVKVKVSSWHFSSCKVLTMWMI